MSTSLLRANLKPYIHFSGLSFAIPPRHPSETSNPRSISTQKTNCRCCLQRIRARMRDRRGEWDSLDHSQNRGFPAKCGLLAPLNGRL
jgi:hypothetical protein